ncbi:MAG: hypothetical protein ACFB0C_10730 [Leptolyngbyaceae cyanobacterium]
MGRGGLRGFFIGDSDCGLGFRSQGDLGLGRAGGLGFFLLM